MAANGLSKIEHIVVVMLENRSFDQMLGFLYTDLDTTKNNISTLGHPFEGLTGKVKHQIQVFFTFKTGLLQTGEHCRYILLNITC